MMYNTFRVLLDDDISNGTEDCATYVDVRRGVSARGVPITILIVRKSDGDYEISMNIPGLKKLADCYARYRKTAEVFGITFERSYTGLPLVLLRADFEKCLLGLIEELRCSYPRPYVAEDLKTRMYK